jgi:uncharacterized protein YjbI with pentapeptide repeats
VLSQTNITQEEEQVINENVARLKEGIEVWNSWREKNWEVAIDLRNVSLQIASLQEANLRNANLSGANLIRTNLRNADLKDANLSGATLSHAVLRKARLERATLSHAHLDGAYLSSANLLSAYLMGANLRDADLSEANLSHAVLLDANLCNANLSGANLSSTNFTESNISGVKWNPRKMRGKYMGIRGIDSSYGNALFKRAAADQDYLDTLENHWKGHKWLTRLFKLWGCIDYGRSIKWVVIKACITMFLFGLTYSIFPSLLGLDCTPDTQGCDRHSWFTPFYFSIVTFTTLGFGDITPKNLVGELIVSFEVIFGYAVLGLLISILADKVVRRS